jgi:hypothetical protein
VARSTVFARFLGCCRAGAHSPVCRPFCITGSMTVESGIPWAFHSTFPVRRSSPAVVRLSRVMTFWAAWARLAATRRSVARIRAFAFRRVFQARNRVRPILIVFLLRRAIS